jgi:hypothetical protein
MFLLAGRVIGVGAVGDVGSYARSQVRGRHVLCGRPLTELCGGHGLGLFKIAPRDRLLVLQLARLELHEKHSESKKSVWAFAVG